MAFIPITSPEIAAGEPNKQELWTKTKDNFDDLDSRVTNNEAANLSTVPIAHVIRWGGKVLDGAGFVRVPFNITVLGARLVVYSTGTSGSVSVDVLRDPQTGTYATILSGNMVVSTTGGASAEATAVSITDQDLDAGDYIRFDIDAIQPGMENAAIIVDYEVRA